MIKYTTQENTTGDLIIIQENEDGTIWSFAEDIANLDYQNYLKWLEDPDAQQDS
jgi:hypothetical protein